MYDCQQSGVGVASPPVVRPTVRCLTDDLGLELPPATLSLAGLEHAMIDAVREHLEHPAIDDLPVTLVVEDQEIALLEDPERGICWMCNIGPRGSTEVTAPDRADEERLEKERVVRVIAATKASATNVLRTAQREPGLEHRFSLTDGVEVISHCDPVDTSLVCVALPRLEAAAVGVDPALADTMMAAISLVRGVRAFGAGDAWPVGQLHNYEIVYFELDEEQ
jgi:hypothetical protein